MIKSLVLENPKYFFALSTCGYVAQLGSSTNGHLRGEGSNPSEAWSFSSFFSPPFQNVIYQSTVHPWGSVSHTSLVLGNTLKELRHSFKFLINFACSFNVCHLQSIWYQSSAFLTNLVHSRFHLTSYIFGVCHPKQTIIERFPFDKQNFSANQKGKKRQMHHVGPRFIIIILVLSVNTNEKLK